MKRKDVDKMCADGLISEAQRESIVAHYHLEESGTGHWLLLCLSLLAAALIVAGASMLLWAYWAELTPLHKVLSGAVGLVAVWAVCFLLNKRAPLLSEGMAVLGAVVWGLNLALHEHLFAFNLPFADYCAIFLAGIVLIPVLSRQRLLVGVVALSSAVLLLSIMGVSESSNSLFYIPWLQSEQNALISIMVLALFWWLVGEKCRRSTGRCRGYYWVSICAFVGFLFLVQMHLLYRKSSYTLVGCILIAAVMLLSLLLKPREVRWGYWLLLMVPTCLLLLLSCSPISSHIVGAVACSVYAALLMLVGSRSHRVAWINYGSLMAVFVMVAVLDNLLGSLEVSGITLIIAGSLELAFVFLMEGQRRRLVRRAKIQVES